MKWSIPAKTFLLGEYAALAGAPAILLTTTPCFELSLSKEIGLHGIHHDSPAGRLWSMYVPQQVGLQWHDPYQGCGGLGASSAQFLGAYLASMHLQKKDVHQQELFNAYIKCAWDGVGLRPSGYDVLAQSLQGCVYIHQQKSICQSYSWPFQDIAFILLHTGQKLATHQHLQTTVLPKQIPQLARLVEQAKFAFEQENPTLFIDTINTYHQHLEQAGFVAAHSIKHITTFRECPDVLAAKGCGAMGADVLLLLIPTKKLAAMKDDFLTKNWKILATSNNLHI